MRHLLSVLLLCVAIASPGAHSALAAGKKKHGLGRGRCSFTASSVGAVIQVSISSGVVRITGIAWG